ncbi:MAG: BrnT family toxin [Burkholderiaceae bacterium]|nr:BrnT family toxin [Burkholderiaceae bacterium]
MPIDFDPEKAAANEAKHGVTFAEAEPVLFDPMGLTREDLDAESEARFVTVGLGALGRVLVVVWTERDDDYRIISARPATPAERRRYEG